MKPTLLILAAGMGSRYGSLKQIDKFGPAGEAIIEYSIYDAIRAGFGKVVFVIRAEIEDDFRAFFEPKLSGKVETAYAFQELDNLPQGVSLPANRQKPWGTAHAVMVAKTLIGEPFAVINADDFYGQQAYEVLATFLKNTKNESEAYGMVGYKLENTLSDYGSVSRGICTTDENSLLTSIVEHTKVARQAGGNIVGNEKNQQQLLRADHIASMNMMGFSPLFFTHCERYFAEFVARELHNPTAEFYLPYVVNQLINTKTSTMRVLPTNAKWFGVTYKEDKKTATQKIAELVKSGVYPNNLWN